MIKYPLFNFFIMKIFISLLFIVLFCQPCYCQSRDVNSRKPQDQISIDSCLYSITYTYHYAKDTTGKVRLFDKQVLEIGTTIVHYYSKNAALIDSIMFQAKVAVNPRKSFAANERELYEDIYWNYPHKDSIGVYTGLVNVDYFYEEPVPSMEWKLTEDTCSILGYTCFRASTRFRGRSYTAWFTPEIPISHGPWKFNGLPGLILKARDEADLFVWEAQNISREQNKKVYVMNPRFNKIIETTRTKLLRLQEKRWKDPAGLHVQHGSGMHVRNNKTGKFMKMAPGQLVLPYIPVPELE